MMFAPDHHSATKRLSWMDDGACTRSDVSRQDRQAFFAKSNHRAGEITAAAQRAKAICGSCLVRDECLAYALATELPYLRFGIWGGMTPEERAERADGVTMTRR